MPMIRPTTLLTFPRLNKYVGREVLLASETFQHTGSFKFRGAWYMASHISHRHLLAASSGNFGQALAFACRELRKRCTVVVPHDAASVKVDAIREFGGEVECIDTHQISRKQRISELAQQYPEAYVASGYDDDLMIAGNGTLGKELAHCAGTIDAIVAPVGGGGLTSGIIVGLRETQVHIPVIGAEPLLANRVTRSMKAGHIVADTTESKTIADGARVTSLGARNWEILKNSLQQAVEVPEDAIREATRLLFRFANLKVEPTAALSLAAILSSTRHFPKRVCCVITGGNVDPRTYAQLIG
jgi:threo-3-hydroxy-L-aspartate ammonia-lyase